MNQQEVEEIKKTTKDLLEKMTVADFKVEANATNNIMEAFKENAKESIVNLDISLKEPQILIGRDGQTLLCLQRILRIILRKKLKENFYLKLDINDYQKQKEEYLKDLAKSLSGEAVLTKEEKNLPPMPSYERRIVHEELTKNKDVIAESRGEGEERHVVIRPK